LRAGKSGSSIENIPLLSQTKRIELRKHRTAREYIRESDSFATNGAGNIATQIAILLGEFDGLFIMTAFILKRRHFMKLAASSSCVPFPSFLRAVAERTGSKTIPAASERKVGRVHPPGASYSLASLEASWSSRYVVALNWLAPEPPWLRRTVSKKFCLTGNSGVGYHSAP
jgi:hypothetical protein